MTFERQVIFWVVALAVFAAFVWLLSDVLLPFVAGMALAYLLDPLARRAERIGIPRGIAALLVLIFCIGIVAVGVAAAAPALADQFASFSDNLPRYVSKLQTLIADPSHPWLGKIFGGHLSDSGKSVSAVLTEGSAFLLAFLKSLWSGGRAVFSLVSLLIITPVVAFYLLCDWQSLVKTVDGWIPLQHKRTVHGLSRQIDEAIAGFVRGQGLVCLCLAAFYAIGLSLAGLNFGLLIGLLTGLFSFIPFVGAMTGFLVAAIVALAQFWPDWTSVLMVVGVFIVGQGIENYVLSPNLVGAKVGLHPVWVMFALLSFGYLFGFVGLLIAVPLAATIGVLTRFAIGKYRESSIYTGRGRALMAAAAQAMAAAAPTQLALALDHGESFARDDFVAGPSNAAALGLIDRWPDWPARTVLLRGPEGSGKSHLAAIWAQESGARLLSPRALDGADVPIALATGALVLENLADREFDEAALFHLLNLAREERAFVLITSRTAPATWGTRLPDLASRLRALPVVALQTPDDALLRAVIVKLFADRQLEVDEALLSFLATRIERSFAAARIAVAALDREALRLKRPVTRALAVELLREP